jgi:hypothetical protein
MAHSIVSRISTYPISRGLSPERKSPAEGEFRLVFLFASHNNAPGARAEPDVIAGRKALTALVFFLLIRFLSAANPKGAILEPDHAPVPLFSADPA